MSRNVLVDTGTVYGQFLKLFIDSETGVHYFVHPGHFMCPCYRADGSLMTSDQRTIASLKTRQDLDEWQII